MKFNTKQDIEAPLEYVFDAFADFEYWERAAMRRGSDVVRTDKLRAVAVGMAWLVTFEYRGKVRKLEIRLDEIDRPNRMTFSGSANSLEGVVSLDFMELSARRTRISVVTELKPRTLGARLFLQSMKLAKSKISKRYDLRVAHLCTEIEERRRGAQKR